MRSHLCRPFAYILCREVPIHEADQLHVADSLGFQRLDNGRFRLFGEVVFVREDGAVIEDEAVDTVLHFEQEAVRACATISVSSQCFFLGRIV